MNESKPAAKVTVRTPWDISQVNEHVSCLGTVIQNKSHLELKAPVTEASALVFVSEVAPGCKSWRHHTI